MSPKLVGLPGLSPASSPLPLALSLPAPTSRLLMLLPCLKFLAGREGAAANLPEWVVYGLKVFTCFPGDLECSAHDGNLEIPNGFLNIPVRMCRNALKGAAARREGARCVRSPYLLGVDANEVDAAVVENSVPLSEITTAGVECGGNLSILGSLFMSSYLSCINSMTGKAR